MPTSQPQYYKNTLHPLQIDQPTLQQALKELQRAVLQGTGVLQAGSPGPVSPTDYSSIYSGTAGIALAFLRLERHKEFLGKTKQLPDFARLAHERIVPSAGDVKLPPPGYMSPIGSSLGPLVVRILGAFENRDQSVSQSDIRLLNTAVQRSLGHEHVVLSSSGDHVRGVDKVLYGRAGLLWAIVNIQYYSHVFDKEVKSMMEPLFGVVPRLVETIIDAGRRGARDYVREYGEEGTFPLMWVYKDERYSLGSVHGIAGILTILLSCETEEFNTYLPQIAETITGLCRICIANNGHLPSSIPSRSSSRSSPLVQICHGAPGLLILLATARRNTHLRMSYWQSEWDGAIRLGAERVWQEGLLSKGGSLCHGLAGNAWSLLALHESYELDLDSEEGNEESDYFLSRALTLLLLARETPPYSTALDISSGYDFRMPDRPYSLYGGLAGELCAWAEACVVVQARLCREEIGQAESQQVKAKTLGFPCLGGNGVRGVM